MVRLCSEYLHFSSATNIITDSHVTLVENSNRPVQVTQVTKRISMIRVMASKSQCNGCSVHSIKSYMVISDGWYQCFKFPLIFNTAVDWATLSARAHTHILRPSGLSGINCLQCFWHCWLGVRKSIWPIKNWVMGYWRGYLSGVWCKWFAYGPADATATPSSLASVKSRMVYLSGVGLPRLSWKKGR